MPELFKFDNGTALYTVVNFAEKYSDMDNESTDLLSSSFSGYFFVNKISLKNGISSLYPAVYADFRCPEAEAVDEVLYSEYLNARKLYPYENIFVFAFTENSFKNKELLSSIKVMADNIISCQNKINGNKHKENFSSFIASPYYEGITLKYDFTVSEEIILRRLLYYAVLSEINIEELITSIETELSENKNKKLIRKEFLDVLTAKLS